MKEDGGKEDEGNQESRGRVGEADTHRKGGKEGKKQRREFTHVSPATSNSNVVSTRRGHHPVVEVQQGSKIIPTPTSHTL